MVGSALICFEFRTAPSTAAGSSSGHSSGSTIICWPSGDHGHQHPLGDLLLKRLAHTALAWRDARSLPHRPLAVPGQMRVSRSGQSHHQVHRLVREPVADPVPRLPVGTALLVVVDRKGDRRISARSDARARETEPASTRGHRVRRRRTARMLSMSRLTVALARSVTRLFFAISDGAPPHGVSDPSVVRREAPGAGILVSWDFAGQGRDSGAGRLAPTTNTSTLGVCRARAHAGYYTQLAGETLRTPGGASPKRGDQTMKHEHDTVVGYTASAVIDGRGTVTGWSAEAQMLLGYTTAEIVGQSAARLLAHDLSESTLRSLADRVPWADQPRWHGTVQLRHRDGHSVAVRLLVHRRRFFGSQEESEWLVVSPVAGKVSPQDDAELLERAFAQQPCGVAIYDSDRRMRLANVVMERGLGLTLPEMRGLRVGDRSAP